MGRCSVRPVEQILWVERSPELCEDDSVTVLAPSFDLALGVVKGKEPVSVQTLIAKPSVEGFDQGIVGWFSRTAEVERDLMQVGPLVECARNKLGTVVDANALRCSAHGNDSIHHCHHLLAGDALSHLDCQTFSGEVVDHGQRADAAVVEEWVGDEVHRPGFVNCPGCRPGGPVRGHYMAPRPPKPHAQPFFAVQPVHALMVDPPAFTPQQYVYPEVAIAHSRRREIPNAFAQHGLVTTDRLVAVRRSIKPQRYASSAFAHPVCPLQVPDQLAPAARP
jgi:hypothetical protein